MPYNLSTLENGCRELGIELSEKQKKQFIQFYEFLVEKNKVMNLTGITEFEEVLTKHFLDSLACVKAVDMTKVKTLMDIGTGAGFPGVPLKIAFPHLEACLLDSLKKRVNFLEESFQILGLEGIKAIHGRAEEYAKNKEYREKYDHPVWKKYMEEGVKEGHGGMDWLVFCDFIKSVQDQTDVPIDVYDLAAWMSISALAEQSIALGGQPVAIPDFTNGMWIKRK